MLKEGKGIEFYDGRVKEIYMSIGAIVWHYDVQCLFNKKEELAASDVQFLYSLSKNYEIDPQD